DADAALTALVAGESPKSLTLHDAAVTLRLDPSGKLATRFPQPKGESTGKGTLPVVRLDGGQLTIKQPGQPDRVFRGMTGSLRSEGEKLVLDGTVNDPD